MDGYIDLYRFFKLFGDNLPSSDGIHLNSCFTRENIWKEYKETMSKRYGDNKALELSSFNNLWARMFPHVKLQNK